MTGPVVDPGSHSSALVDWIKARVDSESIPPMSQAGTVLLTKPKRVYRGNVTDPEGPPGHYLIGTSPEIPSDLYNGQVGLEGRLTIHCWSTTLDNANRLYVWLKALLLDPAEPPAIPDRIVIEFAISKGSESQDLTRVGWQVPMLIEVETLLAA